MAKIYKYLSRDLLPLIFLNEGFVDLKCSYPKDFNDPYELFLTIETKGVDPELLAFYQETVGRVPQFPTICFSKQPDVVPMWAHYAQDSSGFVLEIDEVRLKEHCPGITVGDITYSKTPTVVGLDYVARAYGTGKPRHTYWLQQAAFHASYFTKSSYWSYESERRLIVDNEYLVHQGDLMLVRLPLKCVTAIITGPRAEKIFQNQVRKLAKKNKTYYYEFRLSRNSMKPFFTKGRRSYEFDGEQIIKVNRRCSVCHEPVETGTNLKCHWCAITEAHQSIAARKNPFRMLASYGLLEGYMRSMEDIARRHKE